MSLPKLYVEDGYVPIPRVRLGDAAYGLALQSFPVVCTDAVIYDSRRRTIFLAKRKSKPMTGWWVIGGRTLAGETMRESINRCFMRETKFDIGSLQFDYVCTNEYIWKDRQQVPQAIGCHCLARTFKIELSAVNRELVESNLECNEYDKSMGLREFTREDLVSEGVYSAILDVYDLIFSK